MKRPMNSLISWFAVGGLALLAVLLFRYGPNVFSKASSLGDQSPATTGFIEVPIQGSADYELLTPQLDNNTVIAVARQRTGETLLVQINADTGESKPLTKPEVSRGFESPRFAGDNVIWTDIVTQPTGTIRYMNRLHLLHRSDGSETILRQGIVRQQDLNADVVTWQEIRDGKWGIYAIDLQSSREITVAYGPVVRSFPKICSKEWLIYLQNSEPEAQSGWPSEVELHAYHLPDGEDIRIGSVPFPKSVDVGKQHACDDSRVAWIRLAVNHDSTVITQHIFDLSKRTDRVLNIQLSGLPTLRLRENTLLTSVGYDLRTDSTFDLTPPQASLESLRSGISLLTSNDRVIWLIPARQELKGDVYKAVTTR